MNNTGNSMPILQRFGITNRLPPDIQALTAARLPMTHTEPPFVDYFFHGAYGTFVAESKSSTAGISPTGQAEKVEVTSTTGPGSIPSAVPLSRITGLHKWSGRILEIDSDMFTAELSPLTHEGPVVLADFRVSDLDADENEPVESGDLFYLAVRTVRDRGRRVSRTSTLLLRRLGKWSADEIIASYEAAKAEREALSDYIG